MSEPLRPDWPPATSDAFPRIARLPAYLFARLDEEKRRRIDAGADVIDLGMGNPDLSTPAPVVEELLRHATQGVHHRYGVSRGLPALREAIAARYAERYGVSLDPEREVVVTIGAGEGIAHLMLAVLDQGDAVIVPSPTYPIHHHAVVFAGGRVRTVALAAGADGEVDGDALLAAVAQACAGEGPRPKALSLSFPHNPTTLIASRALLERVVELCRRERLLLIHDFAYADSGFDVEPPSLLQVPGARELGVEFFSMSKSYSMAGWRVGFCVGNGAMVQALARVKSYLDYGVFAPIQLAAARALREGAEGVEETREVYRRRRDALAAALAENEWPVSPPPATMFLWARIPERFAGTGSVEFARLLLARAGVVVSPGSGFGPEGEGFVRFALVEGEARLREAAERVGAFLREG